jgi:N-acetylmuramoyl-L-alanine amidase
VIERRFSTLPPDQVIAQSPVAGSQVQRGDRVSLIISGGSEEFPMPDVVGNGLPLAQGTLEDRGLIVVVEPVVSQNASDTVLSTTPAAGAIVRTGDTVRLQVATSGTPGVELQPYSLSGVGVIIDPDPPIAGAPDISLEVARRLGSLLEASGASVTLLRTTARGSTPDSDRAAKAAESTATVAIGFTVKANGQAGRFVGYSPTAVVSAVATSGALAEQNVAELSRSAPPAVAVTVGGDNVFDAVRIPWNRIQLGVASQRSDQAAFVDPEWADAVARSVYTSLGKLYGVVKSP